MPGPGAAGVAKAAQDASRSCDQALHTLCIPMRRKMVRPRSSGQIPAIRAESRSRQKVMAAPRTASSKLFSCKACPLKLTLRDNLSKNKALNNNNKKKRDENIMFVVHPAPARPENSLRKLPVKIKQNKEQGDSRNMQIFTRLFPSYGRLPLTQARETVST
ncbi:hypothetical protein TcCL_NonESM03156 [Trypanosoma cruzi]|nr:hypothetical protein TcCL_NonESM03156 [Trypanosoma cruzi]